MRPFRTLLSRDEALALLLGAARPVARVEVVPLARARGRVCAREVLAPLPVPPFDRATMDGYAIRAGDAPAPGARLKVAGEAFAGHPFASVVGPGEAVRIATGAPIPPGADAVVRGEDATEEGGRVTLSVAAVRGRFIDPAGSDLATGAPVLKEGVLLTPARLGLLASVGLTGASVFARPRVAVFSSGDEVRPPGEPLGPGQVYDANGASLRALLEEAGAEVSALLALPDELAAQADALCAAAATHDLVLLSGGASVGSRDLAPDALRARGEVIFHGVRVKPGKPLLAGRIGGVLVVGLPGNPTSALSNAALFVLPALRRIARLPDEARRTLEAELRHDVRAEPDRHLVLPVRIDGEGAHPTFKGSGALTSLAASDGWIDVPEGRDLPAGRRVRVHLW